VSFARKLNTSGDFEVRHSVAQANGMGRLGVALEPLLFGLKSARGLFTVFVNRRSVQN